MARSDIFLVQIQEQIADRGSSRDQQKMQDLSLITDSQTILVVKISIQFYLVGWISLLRFKMKNRAGSCPELVRPLLKVSIAIES